MVSIKEQLPNIEALIQKLDTVLKGNLPDFLSSTEDSREKVKGNFRFAMVAVLFLLAIFVFLFISGVQANGSGVNKIVLILALAWTTVFLVSGRAWFTNTKLLAREMNMALVPIFSHTFGRSFLYTNNEENKSKVLSLLEESSLITTSNVSIQSDDSYLVFGDFPVEFHELTVHTKPQTGANNEQSGPVELFKGLLVVAELPKTHDSETYISTDGDRVGFAHRTFWSDLLEIGEVKETVLEWNDFEDKLHVASNDPTAAREILTPDFMSDLYDWWNEHKLNMRIAFKGNQLYLLMPESTIHIASSTTSSRLSVIKKYAVSLVRPMWRSFMLIEDVSH